jgi:hypothetical protein
LLLEWPTRFHGWLESVEDCGGKSILPKVISRIDAALFRGKKLSEGMKQLRETLSPELAQVRLATSKENKRKAMARDRPQSKTTDLRPQTFRGMAAQLGLHVQTLKLLRARGTYESAVEIGKRLQWRSAEMTRFGERLLAMAGAMLQPAPGIKLKFLLALKFRNAEAKAEAVEAVLSGKLPVVGLSGPKPVDVVIDAEAANRWVRQRRLLEGEGTYSFPEAAKAIGVDMTAIPDAIGRGLLATVQVGDLTRVTGTSVEGFICAYIPFVELAHRLETSAGRLVRFIEGRGLQLLTLKRAGHRAKQAVLLRKLEPEVTRLWQEDEKKIADRRSAHICPEPQRVAALEAYIKQMRKDGKPLPRRAGQLDKSIIAQACGFSRNEFYVRQGLARLLDEARLEEEKHSQHGSLDPVDVLRAYLNERRKSGSGIPRKANGKLNKRVIALDCGFSRSLFYKDREAVRMIEAACLGT